jgi:hypothetical protein
MAPHRDRMQTSGHPIPRSTAHGGDAAAGSGGSSQGGPGTAEPLADLDDLGHLFPRPTVDAAGRCRQAGRPVCGESRGVEVVKLRPAMGNLRLAIFLV